MSNFGGPNSLFEKEYNKRFITLNTKLKKVEDKLLVILTSPSKVTDPRVLRTATFWNAMRRKLDEAYTEMATIFNAWSDKELPLVYKRSLRSIQARIENTKAIAETARRSITGMLESTATNQIVAGLIADSNTTFAQALFSGKNNITRITRATQQALISERFIDATVAEAFQAGNLRKAKGVLTSLFNSELVSSVGEQHYVQAGARKYKPSTYAELLTRTKFHDAHSFAALSQATNYGTDLVQVSSHNTTTAICVPFEGKIYSINGRHPLFPSLFDQPPYHPNCLHLLFPTFESAMEVQGTLESFAAFSNDEITRPPVPAGFIPVGSRDIKGVA